MTVSLKSSNPLHAEINRSFLIRWKEKGIYFTYLSTARKYEILVGKELANKHFDSVLNGVNDKFIFKLRGNKLRNNLEITFISK